MTIDATALIVFLLLAVIAGAAYVRVPLKKKAVFLLWAIRIVALVMLACAFFQPAFSLKTLATDKGTTAVFIDASKSMGLFKLDTLLARLRGLCEGATSPKKSSVRYFCFGDSLRPCDPAAITNLAFTDKNSFLPTDFSKWGTVVLLSDGNWSNPSLAADLFENKNCYYIPLPAMSPRAFLRGECISFHPSVVKDSVSIAVISLQGFKTAGNPLEIDVGRNAKPLFHLKRELPAGYFNDTLSLSFPTTTAGRFLYAIGIRDANDTLHCRVHLVGDVVPAAFIAAMAPSSPALDARFLALAVSGDPAWKIDNSDDAARRADALFFTAWDEKSKKCFSLLKPSGVAAFIGCLPCSTRVAVTSDTFSLFPALPDDSLAQRVMQRELPSPLRMVGCDRSIFPMQRMRLGCVVRKNRSFLPAAGPVKSDTLPFLFDGVYGGRGFVALAARDLWSMAFLPLGLDREIESGSLARDVIAIVKEAVRGGLTRTFFAYPLAAEVNEYDSCAFCLVLPPELTVSSLAAQDGAAGRINFSIMKGGKPVLDTILAPAIGALSGTRTFRCRPMSAGTYSYNAVLSFEKKRFSWADTLNVSSNDLEASIQGQNTVLLGQMAVPLDVHASHGLSGVIGRTPTLARNVTNVKIFQLQRSWVLWGIIIALFTLEWALRRKYGLDA